MKTACGSVKRGVQLCLAAVLGAELHLQDGTDRQLGQLQRGLDVREGPVDDRDPAHVEPVEHEALRHRPPDPLAPGQQRDWPDGA